MLEILFVFCALATGDCRTERVPYKGESLTMCLRDAQPMAAEWVRNHPKYHMKITKCGPPSQGA